MDYLQQEGDGMPTVSSSSAGRSSNTVAHGMRFMSRDRPYPCHVCGKRFTQKAHLIIHKRTHTGEKPYSCHICHKRFAQSSHLTVHKRVHTGEKPFFCNFCGMGFCRRPRLEAHILQHVVKEGRDLPSGLKGDTLNGLSMVGLDGGVVIGQGDGVNQESLDAAAQLMELKMKGGFLPQVKYEPEDQEDCTANASGEEKEKLTNNNGGDFNKTGVSGSVGGAVINVEEGKDSVMNDHQGDGQSDDAPSDADKSSPRVHKDSPGSGGGGGATALLGLSTDVLDKQATGLTELTDLQKQALNQTLLLSSPKGQQLNSMLASHHHQLMANHNHAAIPGSGLTMTGLVRTNSRVSLIDFTAEDIMQHLLSRDDVKSCDFCCVVFKDPAMYYLHRSMHDKMDVRCCNLCGKLLKDKYDFTAHFLNRHK